MRMIRTKRAARRLRFHAAWMAGLMMLVDALASVWTLFQDLLPMPPLAFAWLGLGFAVASGVGHLLIDRN